MNISKFEEELRHIINCNSVENDSDTPDYLLAQYLVACLDTYRTTVRARDEWFGFKPWDDSNSAKSAGEGKVCAKEVADVQTTS